MKDKITIKSLAKVLNMNYQTLLRYTKHYTISPYLINKYYGVWEIYLDNLEPIYLFLKNKNIKGAELLLKLIKKQ